LRENSRLFAMPDSVPKPLLEKSCWFSQAKSRQGSGSPSNLWGLYLCPSVVVTL